MAHLLRSSLVGPLLRVVAFGLLAGLLLSTGTPLSATAQPIYVDADATGNATGASWTDAYPSLQNALTEAAGIGDTLWVAEGTYYPDDGLNVALDDETESFSLLDSLKMYGGFSGTETSLSERDVTAHRTILSGDIEQNDSDPNGDGLIHTGDITGTNSYHVVQGSSAGGRLDGFYITAGDASGSLTLDNRGGGILVSNQVDPDDPALTVVRTQLVGNRATTSGGGMSIANANAVLSNVQFIGNTATSEQGGGLHVTSTDYGQIWLTNSVFSGNSAGGNGGAIAQINGTVFLYGSTIAQNSAANNGGGVYVSSTASFVDLLHATVWGNTAGTGAGAQLFTGTSSNLRSVLLEGGTTGIGGAGSVTSNEIQVANPLFVDTTGSDGVAGTPDDNLRVNWASPGVDPTPQPTNIPRDSADIDADGNTLEDLPTDLAGEPRLQGASVDASAYEGGAIPQGTNVVYVDSASGTDAAGSGGSWDAPYRTLQAGLAAARHAGAASTGGFEDVWVAEGTYYPDEGPGLRAGTRTASFSLVDSVGVYGGFQNGDSFSQRTADPATNGTVLSGDIGVPADTSDNSYNVVASGLQVPISLSRATVLDGFTISGGTATRQDGTGGGILLSGFEGQPMSPTLQNLRITQNYAENGAGLAIYAESGSMAQPVISKTDVVGNEASQLMGGVLLSSHDGSLAPQLANVRILGNQAQQGAALGIGAANTGTAAPTLSNTVISGNVSTTESSTVLFRNGTNGIVESVLVNTTWANNRAELDSLSALINLQTTSEGQETSVQLSNSILWNNAARTTATGQREGLRIDSSVVEGGWAGAGSRIVDQNPRFVHANGPDGRPGTADDSLGVLVNSPAVDLGATSRLPPDAADLDGDDNRTERLPVDLENTDRVQGGSVDAGAFEGASTSLPTLTLHPPEDPLTPGTATSVGVTIPGALSPNEGTIFYRPAGAPSFQQRAIDLSSVNVETETTISVPIPGSVVIPKGVQYYIRLTGYSSENNQTLQITAPQTAPTQMGFLPVQIDEMQAQGSFQAERYRMLTVPAALGDRSVVDVLERQYGPYDAQDWRLARWAATDSTYRFGADVTPLRPGEAVWFVAAGRDSLTLENVQSADASEPRSLPLAPGWNQIGSPFAFPVAWANVERPASVRPPVAYDATRPAGERYRFEADVLRPWRGAFVYNTADTSVTVRVPPVEPAPETTQNAKARTFASTSNGYRLQAIAHLYHNDRLLQDRKTWLGFAEEATAGFGTQDLAKPPTVGPHVRLHAIADDGPALAQSLKPPTSEGATWTLRVDLQLEERLRSPKEVTIQLAEHGPRPDGFRRYVVDPSRDRRLPLSNQSVTVRLTPDQPTRRLRVIVGTKAFAQQHTGGAPLTIQKTKLRANAPNPFTESTTISYQLAEKQDVSIAIYDLLGRRVHTLVDRSREPGVHKTTWRAQDVNGQSLASGVYFCRMEAGSYTGTQKLVLVR